MLNSWFVQQVLCISKGHCGNNGLLLFSSPVWLQWLLHVCAVVCVLKSAISVLHLITASRNMAAIDVYDRERERSKAE